MKKEFESILPSVTLVKFLVKLLKEGENLVGDLRDIFLN
jgi:hypothetical protein